MFTPDDPQVTLLAEVGEENIELLIDAATQSRWNNFHTTQAIIRLATAKSKTLVVNALPKNHDLIEAVVRNGWEDDVRETLVSELLAVGPSGYANYLPEVWIYAVARFGDPETYDALLHYFVHGSNRLSTYDAIRRLPGINIAEHVPEAWQQTRNSHDWERVGMAIVAVAYGEKEALAELFDSLSASDYDYYKGRILRTILEHTTAKGSNEALSDWYEANKHALEFDEQTKKFKAP